MNQKINFWKFILNEQKNEKKILNKKIFPCAIYKNTLDIQSKYQITKNY